MTASSFQNARGSELDPETRNPSGEEREAKQSSVVTGPLTGAQHAVSSRKSGQKSRSAFRTISEVADLLDVQQHVLRFWETKFSQIRPLKRGGGRRYYRPEDVALLQKIHHLLYTEGYTIKGVQKLLREQGKNALLKDTPVAPASSEPEAEAQPVQAPEAVETLSDSQKTILESTLDELKELRRMVKPE